MSLHSFCFRIALSCGASFDSKPPAGKNKPHNTKTTFHPLQSARNPLHQVDLPDPTDLEKEIENIAGPALSKELSKEVPGPLRCFV